MTKHIAAFGEVMMRMQLPGYELLSQANELKYSFSGTGVNVTAALAKFGHKGSVVTALPNNALGDAALSNIQKLGISTSFAKRYGDYMGMYFLENGFGIRPSRVTYTNRLESSFNTARDDLYNFNEIAKQIDMVHFCGITLAMNDSIRQQMKSFAKSVKETGGTTLFDCNFRPSLWGTPTSKNGYEKAKPHYEEMLHLADIVMMNENDARYTLGMKTKKIDRKDQLIELIPAVAKKYNIDMIAGTHRTINENNTHSLVGFLFANETFTFSDKVTFSVLDRIGAGDAYTSGIIHGILAGFPTQKVVNFAITAAIIAHTVVGDTPMATENDILKTTTSNISDVER